MIGCVCGRVTSEKVRRLCGPRNIAAQSSAAAAQWLIQSKSPPPSQPFGVRGATSASVGRMAKRRCGKSRGPGPRYFPLFGFALRLLVSETGISQYTWVCLHTRVLVTVWRCLRHRMGRAQGNWLIIWQVLPKRAVYICKIDTKLPECCTGRLFYAEGTGFESWRSPNVHFCSDPLGGGFSFGSTNSIHDGAGSKSKHAAY